MKRVSPDGTYIDYATPRFGIRVRQGACRNVLRTESGWEEYGEEFALPVSPLLIDPDLAEGLSYDLCMNVIDYESFGEAGVSGSAKELRAVLLGEMPFNTVLGG